MTELDPKFNKQVNQLINSLETITYYKHHYVRKTGLKKAIKKLYYEQLTRKDPA